MHVDHYEVVSADLDAWPMRYRTYPPLRPVRVAAGAWTFPASGQ